MFEQEIFVVFDGVVVYLCVGIVKCVFVKVLVVFQYFMWYGFVIWVDLFDVIFGYVFLFFEFGVVYVEIVKFVWLEQGFEFLNQIVFGVFKGRIVGKLFCY